MNAAIINVLTRNTSGLGLAKPESKPELSYTRIYTEIYLMYIYT